MTGTAMPHQGTRARTTAARWLRDQLRSEVLGGTFVGGFLPSEGDLMAWGFSRSTVRDALGLLRDEGLIERIPGYGTFAVSHRDSVRLIEVHGFGAGHPTISRGHTSRVLTRETVTMPAVVAARLGAQEDETCLLYEYIGYLYGQAVGVYTNYVRFPEGNLIRATPLRADWDTLLWESGVKVTDSELTIEILPADVAVATLLEMPVGAPVFGMRRLMMTAGGRPFGFAVHRTRGDRSSWLTQATRPINDSETSPPR